MNLKHDSGAALPLVLVFSVFALIVTTLYVAAQFTIAKPALVAPASFQALCTARSGVWKGMRLMSQPAPDTLARINTLDSMFNKKLFGTPTQEIKNDSSAALTTSDTPTVVSPFSADSGLFGTASLTLAYMPCFKVLTSMGSFRTFVKSVRAFFGGRPFSSPDTVCYLATPGAPTGGVIQGKVAPPLDTATRARSLHMKELTDIVTYYRAQLSEKCDSTMPKAPTTIQSSDGLKGLPDIINGPLLVNGVFGKIAWKEKRRIFVFGDVQFTGNTSVEDIEFVTTGEVRCYDDCRLHNVSVFCIDRFTVGDRAVFSGNALTLSTVLVCKNARVEDRSVIVAYGENRAISSDTSKKRTQLPISVALSQNAFVDGVVVACGIPGAIKTDRNVVVKGILWASGSVAHQGTLYGILRANDLADVTTLTSTTKAQTGAPALHPGNSLTGKIIRLPEVTEYFCPFFLGAIAVVRWEEG